MCFPAMGLQTSAKKIHVDISNSVSHRMHRCYGISEKNLQFGCMFRDDFIKGMMSRLSQEGLTAMGRSKEDKKR